MTTFPTDGNDSITSTAIQIRIDGGAGDDTIVATLWDTVYGGDGHDSIDGTSGSSKLLDGGAGDDTIVANLWDKVYGGEGNDSINGISGSGKMLDGGAGDDTIVTNLWDGVYGGDGNDSIDGTAGWGKSLNGGAGDDTIIGGDWLDSLLGGVGNDTYIPNSGSNSVVEIAGEGIDTVNAAFSYTLGDNVENLTLTGTADISGAGNSLDNTLTGNTGANFLSGGEGDDTIFGDAGNDTSGAAGDDTLEGGTGNDMMDGGAGVDTALFSGLRSAYSVSYDAATGLFTVTGADGVDTLANIEVFQFADGSVLASSLTGEPTGTPSPVATSGDDSLVGSSGADTISALAGNDALDGGAGADRMAGGSGNDRYVVDNASDVTEELAGQGVDTVLASLSWTLADNVENLILTGTTGLSGTGNSQSNTLTGNTGSNVLSGGAGNDTISGGAGNDTLDGGADADRMAGGSGNDHYIVDSASDVTDELFNEGIDIVFASVNWTLGANIENLQLTGVADLSGTGNSLANAIRGNAGANLIAGGAGNDSFDSGAGDDTILGGDGDDRIFGNAGADRLTGNAGADTFVFTALWQSMRGAPDTITDFTRGVDHIDLSGIDAVAGTATDQAFAFIGAKAFDGHAGQLRFSSGLLQADVNGDGAADFCVNISNVKTLSAGDFLL